MYEKKYTITAIIIGIVIVIAINVIAAQKDKAQMSSYNFCAEMYPQDQVVSFEEYMKDCMSK